jgi:hypothetical protein
MKRKKISPPVQREFYLNRILQKIVFLRYMQDPEKIHGRRQHDDRAYQPRARQSILLFILTLSDCIKKIAFFASFRLGQNKKPDVSL